MSQQTMSQLASLASRPDLAADTLAHYQALPVAHHQLEEAHFLSVYFFSVLFLRPWKTPTWGRMQCRTSRRWQRFTRPSRPTYLPPWDRMDAPLSKELLVRSPLHF